MKTQEQMTEPSDANEPGPEELDLSDLESFIESEELAALRLERDEMKDRFMRALADAENARKRGERDRKSVV